MNTYASKLSVGLIGFVAGIAFLISCGSDDAVSNSNAAVPQSAAILKDANGAYIGRIIGMRTVYSPFVLTDQGYRTLIDVSLGRVEDSQVLQYESNDCTGAAYLEQGIKTLGTVFIQSAPSSELAYSSGLVFYTPHDAQSVTVTINSQLLPDLTCKPTSFPFTLDMYQAEPNDPNITGIQNTAYSTPMRIE